MKLILVSYKKIHFMHRDFHRQSVDKLVHKVDNSGYYLHSRAGCAAPVSYTHLFLNDRSRITYNELCRKCQHECKQSFRAVVVDCPKYLSKRSKKKDKTAGNGKIH